MCPAIYSKRPKPNEGFGLFFIGGRNFCRLPFSGAAFAGRLPVTGFRAAT